MSPEVKIKRNIKDDAVVAVGCISSKQCKLVNMYCSHTVGNPVFYSSYTDR